MRKTIPQQIAANMRWSLVLSSIIILILAIFGALITELYAPTFWWAGGIGMTVIGLILALYSWHKGPDALIRLTEARDAEPQELLLVENLAEEMALAAGIPTPHIYVVDDPALNAFATGTGPTRGMVVVTSGLLRVLDREELQAVVAHEVAHIRNNDVRFMTTLAVLVGFVALLAELCLRFVRGGGRKKDGPLLIILLVFSLLAPISSKLIQMAVSRKREFLADSSAAQFTRNPDALVRALEKISSHGKQEDFGSRAIHHMYFHNPTHGFNELERVNIMSTHPPVRHRIAALRNLAGYRPTRRASDDFSDMPDIPQQRH